MKIADTPITGVKKVDFDRFEDDRGAFLRCFCTKGLEDIFEGRAVRQINHSRTTNVGAIRGMHFQHQPAAEMKLIRCLRGKVWDVAVDLRKDSPTYLQWHAEVLSSENASLFVIPEGCAHGFQVLEPNSELLYIHTAYYKPEFEGGILWDDPKIAIDWPLDPIDISQRDQNHAKIDELFQGVKL